MYVIHGLIGQLKKSLFYQFHFVVCMLNKKIRQINTMQVRHDPEPPNLSIDMKGDSGAIRGEVIGCGLSPVTLI